MEKEYAVQKKALENREKMAVERLTNHQKVIFIVYLSFFLQYKNLIKYLVKEIIVYVLDEKKSCSFCRKSK